MTRTLLTALGLLAWSAPAAAQSLFVVAASVDSERERVADVANLRVRSVAWTSATRARIDHESNVLRLTGEIDLRDGDDRLVAGVARRAALGTSSPWQVSMLAGTWAPVIGGGARGVRVALPPALPVRDGWIAPRSPGASGAPDSGPWAFTDRAAPGARSPCEGERLFAAPREGAARWPVPEGARVVQIPGTGVPPAWEHVRVEHLGFAIEGFVRRRRACPLRAIDSGDWSAGSACGDGVARGRRVRLPAATPLYARAGSAAPFATLLREAVGLEQLDSPPGRSCIGTRCTRSPPEPRGVAQWLVELESAGASVLLYGWVRTPAQRLEDAPNATGGFGQCRGDSEDWPAPPRR